MALLALLGIKRLRSAAVAPEEPAEAARDLDTVTVLLTPDAMLSHPTTVQIHIGDPHSLLGPTGTVFGATVVPGTINEIVVPIKPVPPLVPGATTLVIDSLGAPWGFTGATVRWNGADHPVTPSAGSFGPFTPTSGPWVGTF